MISASELQAGIERALRVVGVDYEKVIAEFGQAAACEARAAGKRFTLQEDVRGLVLAQLSNQRRWGPIAENLEAISKVFRGFHPDSLIEPDPEALTESLKALRCGNRAISRQVRALPKNIGTLRAIENDYDSVDGFVTSAQPNEVAKILAEPGRYKLREMGFRLALEYLRNVGIPAIKPDVHVRRALSGERLDFAAGLPSEIEAYSILMRLASEAGSNPTYLDNLLWMFCARDYGNICGASPRCEVCTLTSACNYPGR